MKIETKKDILGKYQKITMSDGTVYIQRFFKELGLLVKIRQT